MRHQFTPEECRRGYWAAIESIAHRHYPLLEGKGLRYLFARIGR